MLVQKDVGMWTAWAGSYHPSHAGGRAPLREWVLYTGPDVRRAVQEAVRFAGRLVRR